MKRLISGQHSIIRAVSKFNLRDDTTKGVKESTAHHFPLSVQEDIISKENRETLNEMNEAISTVPFMNEKRTNNNFEDKSQNNQREEKLSKKKKKKPNDQIEAQDDPNLTMENVTLFIVSYSRILLGVIMNANSAKNEQRINKIVSIFIISMKKHIHTHPLCVLQKNGFFDFYICLTSYRGS
jgi:hypothetical protein